MLITGYLGSGKTTLLNRLLATAQGRRCAVLVNDFGAINVDEKLIEGAVDGVVELENGCICCSREGGLHAAIPRVLRSGSRPEAILIEASGVSNGGELARVLSDDAMRAFARLELIVTTFDCDHWQSRDKREREIIQSQLRHGDVICLTKTDLAGAALRDSVLDIARTEAPGALVISDPTVTITMAFLLGVHAQRVDGLPVNADKAPPAHDLFRSWQVIENAPVTKAAFRSLLHALPAETVRGKGPVHLAELPASRLVFQLVGKRASLLPAGEWGQNRPRTEPVFIALREAARPGADFSFIA